MKIKKSVVANDQQTSEVELQELFVMMHQKMLITMRKESEKMKFTFPQIETLRCVIQSKNSTMKDLSTSLGITPPSATSMIEHLSQKKLVNREVDKKDRRTVRIVPTKKALQLIDTFKEMKSKIFADMLQKLNPEEKKHLITILKILISTT